MSVQRICLIFLAFLVPAATFAAQLEGYSEVPTAAERARPGSGYAAFPDFPRMELVQEGRGTPNPRYFNLIKDLSLANKMAGGYFTSLQVRDLAIRTGENVAYAFRGRSLIIPFAVSVKHTQGAPGLTNGNQGTVEVAGDLLVTEGVAVEVVNFYDSQTLERLGRSLGFNSDIDLEFARAVVKPVLEGFFAEDPSRRETLFETANWHQAWRIR